MFCIRCDILQIWSTYYYIWIHTIILSGYEYFCFARIVLLENIKILDCTLNNNFVIAYPVIRRDMSKDYVTDSGNQSRRTKELLIIFKIMENRTVCWFQAYLSSTQQFVDLNVITRPGIFRTSTGYHRGQKKKYILRDFF